MEWEIYEAEPGAAFVTTDSPVSLYNPSILPPSEAGLALAGTIVFFPLSSQRALLMRHSTPPHRTVLSALAVLDEPSLEGTAKYLSREA